MLNALKNGEVFSGCKILSRCGKGAYGVVYLAENVVSQKIVIKIIQTDVKHISVHKYIPPL